MNYRQLKKQYKRKHGFNPPKGYSRALIRETIKKPTWQAELMAAAYKMSQSIVKGFRAAEKTVKRIAAALQTYQELIETDEEETP